MKYFLMEVFSNFLDVIKRRKTVIIILMLIYTVITLFTQYYLYTESAWVYGIQQNDSLLPLLPKLITIYAFLIIAFLIIPIIINGTLAIICYQALFPEFEIKFSVKNYFNYALFHLIFIIILFTSLIAFISLVLCVLFIPLLGFLFATFTIIGYFILVFYFIGYYRFLPYIALSEGRKNVILKVKSYVKGHFPISLIAIIILIIYQQIFNHYTKDVFNSFQTSQSIICAFISVFFSLIFTLFDIAFIITARHHYNLSSNNY